MRHLPKSSNAAWLLTAVGLLAPAAGFCRQAAPAAPAEAQRRAEPPPRALTTEERTRLIDRIRPNFMEDSAANLLSALSDRGLLDLTSQYSAPSAAPDPGAQPPPPPTPTVRIHNPTAQNITLRLEYAGLFCGQQTVTLASGESKQQKLCKSTAKVKFDGNPATVSPATIGASSCYLVGRFDGPPRWALDACPS